MKANMGGRRSGKTMATLAAKFPEAVRFHELLEKEERYDALLALDRKLRSLLRIRSGHTKPCGCEICSVLDSVAWLEE